MPVPRFGRVIVKLSGEALLGDGVPISHDSARRIAAEIGQASDDGAQIGVVIGGGNILRGSQTAREGRERVRADHAGMLATVLNGLALARAFEADGKQASVLSAVPCGPAAELYHRDLADERLRSGHIVMLTGGTGNPFFSTDTAAALRAAELGAGAILKATKVDGVYSADPVTDPDATLYSKLTYEEVLRDRLGVMDMTAVSLARDRDLPIIVFSLFTPGNIARAVRGEDVGTIVKED
ncbi:MAG: UMP kinase [Candidatus Eisenbacteria bacterium]|nr:UMP kinase [Candidatus Eisenbacteria bacterium]